jgi:ribosomal protein S18 acetylase RimI-like enzyme
MFWFLREIGLLLLQKPRVILSLFLSLLPNHNNNIPLGQIELTYIGTHPEFQRQGIGNLLIHEFITEAKMLGFSQVSLSVETDNPSAISLYKKMGFLISATFTEGSYHRHRMVLDLE